MNLDLDVLMDGLSGFGPSLAKRPDGSVLLVVAHSGKRQKRVVDDSYTADEVIRMVKFDLLSEGGDESLAEAVEFSSNVNLPTYTHLPVCRTRSANLWESRKLKNL